MRSLLPSTLVLVAALAACNPFSSGSSGGSGTSQTPTLRVAQAQPYSTLDLGFVGLAAEQSASVRFFDTALYSIKVPATGVAPLTVVIPPFIDLERGAVTNGRVWLEIQIEGRTPIPVAGGPLTILPPPATDRPPGQLTLAFLEGVYKLQSEAAANLIQVRTVTVPAVLGQTLSTSAAALETWYPLVEQLSRGQTASIPVGVLEAGGKKHPLKLDGDALALAEAMLTMFLTDLRGSATAAGRAEASTTLEDLARDFPKLFDGVSAESIALSKKIGQGFAVATAVAAGVAILAGSSALVPAILVVGATAWMVTSFAPAAIGAFLKLGGRAALDEPRSLATILPEFNYVANQMLTGAAGLLSGMRVEAALGAGAAATFGIISAITPWTEATGVFIADVTKRIINPPGPGEGTFVGQVDKVGRFQNTLNPCQFDVTVRGPIEVRTKPTGGGTAVVSLSWNSVPVGGGNCTASSGSIAFTSSVTAGSTVRFEGGSPARLTFVGQKLANSIVGDLVVTFQNTTGEVRVTNLVLQRR